jgi:enamine deaminase RidA (YjgF/YER057c/UK114 family)
MINPVRQQFFGNARPASTLVGVNELAIPGMLVEIEVVVGLNS